MKIILASNSPRRREILSQNGYDFEVRVSAFNEIDDSTTPEESVTINAIGKARDIFEKLDKKDDVVVLGADTAVFFGGRMLGKPKTEKQAKEFLEMLSGNVHTVITGYCLISKDKQISSHTKTEVLFNELSEETINSYVKSGLPLDKAGGYGIQDGYDLVKSINGSLSNVIGLPIEDVATALRDFL